jgi:hypothetical protein
MLKHDPTGENGPKVRLADKVEILEPKEDKPAHPAPTHSQGGYKSKNVDSMRMAPSDRYNPAKPTAAAATE